MSSLLGRFKGCQAANQAKIKLGAEKRPAPRTRIGMARKDFGPGWAAREVKASNKRKANAPTPLPRLNPVQFSEPRELTEGIMCRKGCGQRIVGSLADLSAHNDRFHA